MSTVQIVPASTTTQPMPAPPQTVQEDMALILRQVAESSLKRRPSARSTAEIFHNVFRLRKDMIAKALAACEKPSVSEYFEKAAAIQKSYDEKAKKAATAAGVKKTTTPAALKEFLAYWNKINANNELEFIGAIYVIDALLKSTSPIEEFSAFAEKAYATHRDQDEQQIAFLKELIHEFSYTSRERIVAGAKHAARLVRELLGVWS